MLKANRMHTSLLCPCHIRVRLQHTRAKAEAAVASAIAARLPKQTKKIIVRVSGQGSANEKCAFKGQGCGRDGGLRRAARESCWREGGLQSRAAGTRAGLARSAGERAVGG